MSNNDDKDYELKIINDEREYDYSSNERLYSDRKYYHVRGNLYCIACSTYNMEAKICTFCSGLSQNEHTGFIGDKIGISHVGEYETCCNEDGDDIIHWFRKCDNCNKVIHIDGQ